MCSVKIYALCTLIIISESNLHYTESSQKCLGCVNGDSSVELYYANKDKRINRGLTLLSNCWHKDEVLKYHCKNGGHSRLISLPSLQLRSG